MPNLNEFYDRVGEVNGHLQDIHGELQTANGTLTTIQTDLDRGFTDLANLQQYTNTALAHLANQADTLICILEHVSKNTCMTVNQGQRQVQLQESIGEASRTLMVLYELTHGDSAISLERERALQRRLDECCPEEEPAPACAYERCPTPPRLTEPPQRRVDVR